MVLRLALLLALVLVVVLLWATAVGALPIRPRRHKLERMRRLAPDDDDDADDDEVLRGEDVRADADEGAVPAASASSLQPSQSKADSSLMASISACSSLPWQLRRNRELLPSGRSSLLVVAPHMTCSYGPTQDRKILGRGGAAPTSSQVKLKM